MKNIKRKNTSHRDGVYWIPQWQLYRDGKLIGVATKTGTSQDNYPWDWELAEGVLLSGKKSEGYTGLLSEAIQEIDDAAKDES